MGSIVFYLKLFKFNGITVEFIIQIVCGNKCHKLIMKVNATIQSVTATATFITSAMFREMTLFHVMEYLQFHDDS